MHFELTAELPPGSIVVVAGRRPPPVEWRTDPVWSTALDLVPLRSLSAADAGTLVDRLAVPASVRADAIGLAGGHPLALSLLARYLTSIDEPEVPADLTAAPDLVATLLGRLVDDVPSETHRGALRVLALARVTNRSMLRATVGDETGDTFDWLETQPFADLVEDGVR